MKIKGKGIVRIEQITCRVLLLICVITFVLCCVMEYLFPLWLEKDFCEFIHIDFLKNITLGISGSAFVSFVCLAFPYFNKIIKFKREFFDMFIRLRHYYRILNINIDFARYSKDNFKRDEDLRNNTKNHLNELNKYISEYLKSDFHTKKLDILFVILIEYIVPIFQLVLYVTSLILKDRADLNIKYNQYVLICAKKDIYNYLSEKMNKQFKTNVFFEFYEHMHGGYDKFVYKKIIGPNFSIIYCDTELYLEDYKKKVCGICENEAPNFFNFKEITNEIENIIKCNERTYLKECVRLKRMFNFITKNNAIKVDREIVDYFNNALDEDRINDAGKVIENLKNVLVKNGFTLVKSCLDIQE